MTDVMNAQIMRLATNDARKNRFTTASIALVLFAFGKDTITI
jgi:hypothetical protein